MNFSASIDINDTKHRYYLCREATHAQLKSEFCSSPQNNDEDNNNSNRSGGNSRNTNVLLDIKVVGKYYPNRALATPAAPCLQLKIESSDDHVLNQIREWILKVAKEGPPATSQPKPLQEKLFLPMPYDRNHQFALKNAILGPHHSHIKFINLQSGATLSLKGQGSGALSSTSSSFSLSKMGGGEQGKEETAEPLHVLIIAYRPEQVQQAKALVMDLFKVIKFEYQISCHLGYFTPLGGMFAPDSVLIQVAKTGNLNSIHPNAAAATTTATIINNNPYMAPTPMMMSFPYAIPPPPALTIHPIRQQSVISPPSVPTTTTINDNLVNRGPPETDSSPTTREKKPRVNK